MSGWTLKQSTTGKALTLAMTAGLVLAIGGCVDRAPPNAHPGPYDSPVDAVDASRAPYDPSAAADSPNQPLTQDISQLREARNAYEQSQIMQAADARARQAECRNDPNARLVRIQDGSGDPNAVYCQRAPGSGDE